MRGEVLTNNYAMKFVKLRKLIFGRKLVFFHIGKCAGSSFHYSFMDGSDEIPIRITKNKSIGTSRGVLRYLEHNKSRWKHLRSVDEIVTIIRNPINRLESAFYYSKTKYTYDYPAEYLVGRVLLEPFDTFTDWISALMDEECKLHRRADACLGHVYHFKRGYQYYFHSALWIKNNAHRFFFVGEVEHYQTDLKILSELIGNPAPTQGKVNETKKSNPPSLSSEQTDFLSSLLEEEFLCYLELAKLSAKRSF